MPELPINTIIIIIICIAVFLAVAILFFSVWNKSYPGINLEAAKNSACQMLVSMGCNSDSWNIPVNNFDANKDTYQYAGAKWKWEGATYSELCDSAATESADNLAALCRCYYGKQNELECKSLCMCGAGGGGGGGGGGYTKCSAQPRVCYSDSDCPAGITCDTRQDYNCCIDSN